MYSYSTSRSSYSFSIDNNFYRVNHSYLKNQFFTPKAYEIESYTFNWHTGWLEYYKEYSEFLGYRVLFYQLERIKNNFWELGSILSIEFVSSVLLCSSLFIIAIISVYYRKYSHFNEKEKEKITFPHYLKNKLTFKRIKKRASNIHIDRSLEIIEGIIEDGKSK